MQIHILCLYVHFYAVSASVALGYMVQCDVLVELWGLQSARLGPFMRRHHEQHCAILQFCYCLAAGHDHAFGVKPNPLHRAQAVNYPTLKVHCS